MSNNSANKSRYARFISIRVIVTVAAVALIAASVIAISAVAERNTRATLIREMEKRLVIEARNLALLGSSALLSDYPELTLHPAVKEMQEESPELVLVYVVDHNGVIQGHGDVEQIGALYQPDASLQVSSERDFLDEKEVLLSNSEMIVVERQVSHPGGKTIGTVLVGLEQSHAEASLRAARRQQLMLLVPILAIAVLLTMVLMKWLLRPISALRRGLERIGHGELSARVEIKSRTELDLLAESINDMASALESAQDERIEKERLTHEMDLAREIQQSLLPVARFSDTPFFIDGAQKAAAKVGGDYYDIFELSGDRVGIVVADVAGKGLAGCLVASMLSVLIRSFRDSYESPTELLLALDEAIIDSLRPGTFVTVFYGVLETLTGQLTWASAGHNPVLHFKADTEEIHWLETDGVPLGISRSDALRETLVDSIIHIAPGDLVLETTDGINEAVDDKMVEFGFNRTGDTVLSLIPGGFESVLDGLQTAVLEWEGGLPSADDKTVVAIGRVDTVSANTSVGAPPASDRRMAPSAENFWAMRDKGEHISFSADVDPLDLIGAWLRQRKPLDGLSADEFALVEQGLYEILANIAEHGCSLDPSKNIDVWWFAQKTNEGSWAGVFLIRDRGAPPLPEHWSTSHADRGNGRGYGMKLIDRTVAEVKFKANTPEGNLTLVLILSSWSPPVPAMDNPEITGDVT